ncbi:S1C family serine protease [Amycolatopsis minnesotensis]|uniref:Trypsin-like peptidase domain-containing protein n=1 Tax=Amycolatopsis minnesotensis TaxID=337894 RepID=A0ABN2RKB7_9PSEU
MMSEHDPKHAPGEPRLAPRPVVSPPVDPAEAATFGRPRGVDGAFDKLYAPGTQNGAGPKQAQQPPESLAEAFSRPPGAEGIVLQRPSDYTESNGNGRGAEKPLWTPPGDPWRDPGAGAVLASPAVHTEEPREEAEARPKSAMLSLPEVLFGRRVKPVALGLLGVIALLVGAVGGLVGWWLTEQANSLTGSATIAESDAGKERAPGSVADVAKRVSPAVVSIEVLSGQSGVSGSGVLIDPKGYILTNNHVVSLAATDGQAKITTVFLDGSRLEAKIVGTDPKSDLAVIKVNVANPTVLQIGKSGSLQPGDSVIAVGSPLGLENTVTSGIVSALHRPVTAQGENGDPPMAYDAIQTDAPINRGNSGGALVDSTGALIGINTSIRTDAGPGGQGGSIGIGFAIPSDDAVKIAQTLIKSGQVKHADIGVNAASVSANSSEGARVQNVPPGSPAQQAGIAEGDVITKVGDRMVRTAAELTVAVRGHAVGEVVPVQVVRDGRQLTVDVTLGSD